MGSGEAREAAERIEAIYGDDLVAADGVLHVAAVWGEAADRFRVLRIGPDSPRSATDEFALGLARVRADAILTTGRILRDEPDTTHALPGREAGRLAAWRRECRLRREPPLSVVLSSGRELDLGHPLFAQARRALVLTTQQGAARLAEPARRRGVEVLARARPGPRDSLALLRERGFRSISVEAGPSSARALYEDPIAVDELLLSVYRGAAPPDSVRGAAFPDPDRLRRHFYVPAPAWEVREASGRWAFSRHLRRR